MVSTAEEDSPDASNAIPKAPLIKNLIVEVTIYQLVELKSKINRLFYFWDMLKNSYIHIIFVVNNYIKPIDIM